jgi:hypothetical protein
MLLTIASTAYCSYILAGRIAAGIAAIFIALEPNLIANSGLLTVDCAFAAVVITALAAILSFQTRTTFLSAALAGGCLGYGLATKFSILVVAPLCLIAFAVALARSRTTWRLRLCYLLLFLFAGFVAANAPYNFDGVFAPLSSIKFHSGIFTAMAQVFPSLRLPLAEPILTGVDLCLRTDQNSIWNVILLGSWHPHGTPLFFPVLYVLKSPIALLLFNLGGAALFIRHRLWRYCLGSKTLLFVLFFAALYFAFIFKTQIGYRFILFLLPIIAALSACGWSTIITKLSGRIVALATLLLMLELLPYQGSMLSFSNILLPAKQEYKYFADSNLSWGQNYAREHAIGEKFAKDHGKKIMVHRSPIHILPGYNIISVNDLTGVWFNFNRFKWLRENLEAKTVMLRTLYFYIVSPDDFRRYLRDERTLTSHASSLPHCENVEVLRDGTQIKLKGTDSIQHLCVEVSKVTNIRIRSLRGVSDFSPINSWGMCSPTKLYQGTESWFRMLPGIHAFCLDAAKEWRGLIELDPRIQLQPSSIDSSL